MGLKMYLFAVIYCMIQAMCQIVTSLVGIAEHYCYLNFLRNMPVLVYIKILYFNNPERCGSVIRIGHLFQDVPNQAHVFFDKEPFTSRRTLIVTYLNMSLGVAWFMTTVLLLRRTNYWNYSRCIRWPFVAVTLAISFCDIIVATIYANDIYQTKTLDDIIDYIGGRTSGLAGNQLYTSAAAWTLFGLYFRFGIFLILNIACALIIAVGSNPRNIFTQFKMRKTPDNVPKLTRNVEIGEPVEEVEIEDLAKRIDALGAPIELNRTFGIKPIPAIPRAHRSSLFGTIKNLPNKPEDNTVSCQTKTCLQYKQEPIASFIIPNVIQDIPPMHHNTAEIAQLPWSYMDGKLPTIVISSPSTSSRH